MKYKVIKNPLVTCVGIFQPGQEVELPESEFAKIGLMYLQPVDENKGISRVELNQDIKAVRLRSHKQVTRRTNKIKNK